MEGPTMKKPLVSVIITSYNARKWLRGCLESLRSQTYANFEIIIVDNVSTDGSVGYVRRKFPEVQILKNEKNVGFGTANNRGARECKGELLFFLNTDTVLRNDLLDALVRCKLESKNNIIGPRGLNFKGKDNLEGKYLGMNFLGSVHGPVNELFFIDGSALMISKADFWKLGGFDEKYFLYCEDLDLCWRALLFGMKLGVCEDASLIHFGGGTSEPTMSEKGRPYVIPVLRRYEVEKNTLRNLLKNYSTVNVLWAVPLFLLQELAEAALYLVTGNFKMMFKILSAVWWNVENIGDTLKERRRIQQKRKISDIIILSKTVFKISKINALLRVGIPSFKE
jgi:GT2 family glycosyltransferase